MATAVLMPKQGNTVESCLLVAWKKQKGDPVKVGDILCAIETDKAAFELEAEVEGVLLDQFFADGADVPVMTPIAAIGKPGEPTEHLRTAAPAAEGGAPAPATAETAAPATTAAAAAPAAGPAAPASPRARKLADEKGVSLAGVAGTGPGGRIIERDVAAALAAGSPLTPAAREKMAAGGVVAPAIGSGIGGRVVVGDLQPAAAKAAAPAAPAAPAAAAPAAAAPAAAGDVKEVAVTGIRKLIATRMHQSLQATAQLTMNAAADASAMVAFRQKLKASPEDLGVNKISINDLVLLAVARTLARFPALNALYDGTKVYQHARVHLAFAVDTERGLMVPVIRNADRLSLKALAKEAHRLTVGCRDGGISPDELNGGTFTVSNLGVFGIDSFTPILNPPQVGILGVGGISPRPVERNGKIEFVPHLGLSLTINHMVVDGGPAARFLQALSAALADIQLLLAM